MTTEHQHGLTEAEVDFVLERFDQTDPAMYREIVVELAKKLAKAEAFKRFVHDRLSEMGVPDDPNPERTKERGCRIGSRLSYVEVAMSRVVTWRSGDDFPDPDIDVLIATDSDSLPVWPGYHDGQHWYFADGGVPRNVSHWAELVGPVT